MRRTSASCRTRTEGGLTHLDRVVAHAGLYARAEGGPVSEPAGELTIPLPAL